MYKEIEIEVLGKDGKKHPQTINIANINHYRSFIDTKEESGEQSKLVTMVYFQGNIKATFVACSYQDFKRKIQDAMKS
jgi:hypothetical protein